jgi:hypothetical protein
MTGPVWRHHRFFPLTPSSAYRCYIKYQNLFYGLRRRTALYLFRVSPVAGTINPTAGLYTAPGATSGTDVVRVTDSVGTVSIDAVQ